MFSPPSFLTGCTALRHCRRSIYMIYGQRSESELEGGRGGGEIRSLWCAQWVRYDRIIPDVHISGSTLHTRLDPARWQKIHTTHSWYYPPSTPLTSTSTPPRLWTQASGSDHLFPGFVTTPSSFTCFWTTGAGESSIRHPLSLSLSRSLALGGFHELPFGGSPPLNHQCSRRVSQSQFYLC